MQLKKEPLARLLEFLGDVHMGGVSAKRLGSGWRSRLRQAIDSLEIECSSMRAMSLIADFVPAFTNVKMKSGEIVGEADQSLIRIKLETFGDLTVRFYPRRTPNQGSLWSVVLIFKTNGRLKFESYTTKPGLATEKFRAGTQAIYKALQKIAPEDLEKGESYSRFRSFHSHQAPKAKVTRSEVDPNVAQVLAGLNLES